MSPGIFNKWVKQFNDSHEKGVYEDTRPCQMSENCENNFLRSVLSDYYHFLLRLKVFVSLEPIFSHDKFQEARQNWIYAQNDAALREKCRKVDVTL